VFYADRVRETTTTTGTGAITLAGAVAQYQSFQSRVFVGDTCEYVILDANGTGWEVGLGTLTASTTLARTTVYESSNSDSQIALSSGTHKVFLTFSSHGGNARLVQADTFIDCIASGLVLPATSASLGGTITAGSAYVIGQRIAKGALAHTYTASKDTYVDLGNDGTVTFNAVNNGAGAPALTANSIRLGFVTTGASTITGATTAAKDSLGNWMGNIHSKPACMLLLASGSQSIANNAATTIQFGAGTEQLDNSAMHSTVTNNTRITVPSAGVYSVSGSWDTSAFIFNPATTAVFIYILKNGATWLADVIGALNASTSQFGAIASNVLCAAGDYIELQIYQNSGLAITIPDARLSAVKVT